MFTVRRITTRRDPIYHSTYTGKPPDEPAVLGVALNEVFVPLLARQFPEIVDFYLPPEGCSYRIACVAMKKQYPGHAKRVMFGVWSFLRQFMYTKFIIVTDDDVNVRDWKEVIWALATRVDPRARHADHRAHADRLPRFREPGARPGLQDGDRRDQQVARRDRPPLGHADRDERGGEAARGRAVARARTVVSFTSRLCVRAVSAFSGCKPTGAARPERAGRCRRWRGSRSSRPPCAGPSRRGRSRRSRAPR